MKKLIKQFDNNDLVIILVIFLISLCLRITAIDISLNIDETLWVSRGYLFITGILNFDFGETYQTHHPGVINMWMIGISEYLNFFILKIFPEGLTTFWQYPSECLKESPSYCPINAYIMPRFIQGIITSASMAGFYWFSKQLFGKWQAILATCLLIFSPFFLAYQRFITTDALQTDFSILAVLSFLLYLSKNQKLKFFFVSGFFLGLGILSKIGSLFFLPVIILILILKELKIWRNSFFPIGWKKTIRHFMLFSLIMLLTIFLLWPILIHNLFRVWELFNNDLPQQLTKKGTYFLGETIEYPNIYFYPLVLIYRLSPFTQIGLITFLINLTIPSLRNKLKNKNQLIVISIFSILPLIFLSLIPSKIDRYVVLVYPEFFCLASAGWLIIIGWLKNWLTKIGNKSIKQVYLIISFFTINLIFLVSYFPYYVSYYNPLFGGATMAEKIIMVGNGEGLDETARWLNQKPDAEKLNVVSWYDPVFSSYFKGNVITDLKQANFIVTYINQVQRNYDAEWKDYIKEKEPVYVFKLHGVEYVKVYQVTD